MIHNKIETQTVSVEVGRVRVQSTNFVDFRRLNKVIPAEV